MFDCVGLLIERKFSKILLTVRTTNLSHKNPFFVLERFAVTLLFLSNLNKHRLLITCTFHLFSGVKNFLIFVRIVANKLPGSDDSLGCVSLQQRFKFCHYSSHFHSVSSTKTLEFMLTFGKHRDIPVKSSFLHYSTSQPCLP